jgi:hypothetical protein
MNMIKSLSIRIQSVYTPSEQITTTAPQHHSFLYSPYDGLPMSLSLGPVRINGEPMLSAHIYDAAKDEPHFSMKLVSRVPDSAFPLNK